MTDKILVTSDYRHTGKIEIISWESLLDQPLRGPLLHFVIDGKLYTYSMAELLVHFAAQAFATYSLENEYRPDASHFDLDATPSIPRLPHTNHELTGVLLSDVANTVLQFWPTYAAETSAQEILVLIELLRNIQCGSLPAGLAVELEEALEPLVTRHMLAVTAEQKLLPLLLPDLTTTTIENYYSQAPPRVRRLASLICNRLKASLNAYSALSSRRAVILYRHRCNYLGNDVVNERLLQLLMEEGGNYFNNKDTLVAVPCLSIGHAQTLIDAIDNITNDAIFLAKDNVLILVDTVRYCTGGIFELAIAQQSTLATVYKKCPGLGSGVAMCAYLALSTSVHDGYFVTVALP